MFGRILQVETVNTGPYEFRVRRRRTWSGEHRMGPTIMPVLSSPLPAAIRSTS